VRLQLLRKEVETLLDRFVVVLEDNVLLLLQAEDLELTGEQLLRVLPHGE